MPTDNELLEKLRPHQKVPFAHLKEGLPRVRGMVDTSGTGTGKTYVAAATAISLGEPTLVVCPKIARSSWERAAEYLGEKVSVIGYEMLRTGNSPFGKWSNENRKSSTFFVCEVCQCRVDPINPQPCPHHPRGIHCIVAKKKSPSYGRFSFHRSIGTIIFDEAHRCNGVDSLNADMLIGAKRGTHKVLGLSATLAHSPIQLRALGYLLDLHNLESDKISPARIGVKLSSPSFKRWAESYGCRYDQRWHGWKWFLGAEAQKETMSQISASIIPSRGVRVTAEDIPGFPERDIQAELYDIDEPEKVNGAYTRMAAALEEHKLRTSSDVNPEHPLTKILRARQEVELLKVPIFAELAQDYLDKGFSVACFVNFRQTIEELQKILPSARIIDGSPESVRTRQETTDLFQSNVCRSLLVNSDAGGICLSLHDLFGGFPRVGLVSPCFSAVTLRQVFGRFQREGGKSRSYYRIIFANGTVEMPIWRAVRPKLDNIDALLDADLCPDNLKFLTDLN
jgi:hypothetical protein